MHCLTNPYSNDDQSKYCFRQIHKQLIKNPFCSGLQLLDSLIKQKGNPLMHYPPPPSYAFHILCVNLGHWVTKIPRKKSLKGGVIAVSELFCPPHWITMPVL